MTRFTLASFNTKNLIGADQEYYKFEKYTPEEYAWKQDWLANQLLSMNADIVCFQEIFEKRALRKVIAEADRQGKEVNAAALPDQSKRYHRKAIFSRLEYVPYTKAQLAFAANASDGVPGHRRPGVAILSRFGFAEPPQIVQQLPEAMEIPFQDLTGHDGGTYVTRRLSRPILKARIPVGDTVITIFNCHLKSKHGEFAHMRGAAFPQESDLLNYDAPGRAMGALRATMRRMAEAWVLRVLVLEELDKGYPVMVVGDMNDSENAVSTEIISGETPFRNYAWMRRHDAQKSNERYTKSEAEIIHENIDRVRLHSAEKMFVRKSMRDMIFTSAFGGVYESIDQIHMSRHFHPEYADKIGEMEYLSVFNDHLTDGSHPEAPYNKLASDHGQLMAHFHLNDDEE